MTVMGAFGDAQRSKIASPGAPPGCAPGVYKIFRSRAHGVPPPGPRFFRPRAHRVSLFASILGPFWCQVGVILGQFGLHLITIFFHVGLGS